MLSDKMIEALWKEQAEIEAEIESKIALMKVRSNKIQKILDDDFNSSLPARQEELQDRFMKLYPNA